jgi:SET domain-containing protein
MSQPKYPGVLSWIDNNLKVSETVLYGKGVFATSDIKKGSILAIIGGFIMTLEEESCLEESVSDLAVQIHDDFVIGINKIEDRQLIDNFNHSCNPNAGFGGQIFLRAMRDIKTGEQVTFDYAMTLGGTKPYELDCLCGATNCRKKITNHDWKKIELQEKYAGYFQWYIEEKIKK